MVGVGNEVTEINNPSSNLYNITKNETLDCDNLENAAPANQSESPQPNKQST